MKIVKIMLIVFLSIFLVACGSGGGEGVSKKNFKQGVSELNIEFLNNAPPAKIYPDSNFKMILKIDNQAAYKLLNGKISLIGINKKYFDVRPETQSFDDLEGKSLLAPVGGKQFIEFEGTAGKLFQNANSYRANYFLKVSYDSNVEFSDTICINPRLYEMYDSGCQMQSQKSYSGQGAPLAVTNVEIITYPVGSGAKLEFRFNVAKRGSGEVDNAELKKALIGNKEFQKCEFIGGVGAISPKKALFSKDKQEATLVCETILSDQNSYETTVTLDFDYKYDWLKQYSLVLVNPNSKYY
jgi:hypothetical protein